MAKNKKPDLPRRIAGVKVPKAIRKSGVGALLASPTSKALIAEAIMAAGAVGAAAKAADRQKGGDGEPDAEAASAALAFAAGEAARAFVDALKQHEHGFGDRAEAAGEPRSWAHDLAADEVTHPGEHTDAPSKKEPAPREADPH